MLRFDAMTSTFDGSELVWRGGWSSILCILFCLLGSPLAVLADSRYSPQPMDDTAPTEVLRVQAESGDARAAFLLGIRFASGRAVVRDDSEAVRWFRQAAEGGLAEGEYNLGVMYASGRGIDRDTEQAARWYGSAADKGLVEAQYNLGLLYLDGAGVQQDDALAVQWLQKAADQGLARAEYNLGVLNEYGKGMPRDLAAAVVWYRRAANQGYAPALERLAALGAEQRPLTPEAPLTATAVDASAVEDAVAGDATENTWVRSRDPSRYTIQLLSRRDETSVRDYVRKHQLDDQGGYFKISNDGTIWYSVVYGDFSTHAEATEAAGQLPRSLGVSKPWVRNFGVIQQRVVP